MAKEELLIIEDDPDINLLLSKLLQKAGYGTRSAYSGTEGLLLLKAEPFALVLLDLMLPGMTGQELIPAVRAFSKVPVIVISARTAMDDKVEVLKMGADDYITKPFDGREVAARVEAQLRRADAAAPPAPSSEMRHGGVRLDASSREVWANETSVDLTATEFDLLALFLSHPEKVFTRESLYCEVWHGEFYGEDNTVNVHVSNLRNKLARAGCPGLIKTVWGIGFKLV